jgi:hypothetical protein
MKVIIAFGFKCPACERWQARTAHGTTVAQCEAKMGRACEFPFEHHPAKRRPYITVRRDA